MSGTQQAAIVIERISFGFSLDKNNKNHENTPKSYIFGKDNTMTVKRSDIKGKIGNPAQLGGIETSIIDNGPAKGTRIAWINTGSGLMYKAVIDRGLDIVDAFYNGISLSWISHAGITAPRPGTDRALEWLWTFPGGLVTTCGLTHIGGPQGTGVDEVGLHGKISNIPATLQSIDQPDPAIGKMDFSITALMKESRVFGPHLELKRTISGTLGDPAIKINDILTNRHNSSASIMLLYHCNLGYPLIDEGADIFFKGKCVSRAAVSGDDPIFASRHNYKKIPAPLTSHKGYGEACGFVTPKGDTRGNCVAGVYNKKLGFALAVKFNNKQLPKLANWQHWGPGEYVTGLEPGTNWPIGSAAAKKQKELTTLRPNQSKNFDLTLEIITDKTTIKKML